MWFGLCLLTYNVYCIEFKYYYIDFINLHIFIKSSKHIKYYFWNVLKYNRLLSIMSFYKYIIGILTIMTFRLFCLWKSFSISIFFCIISTSWQRLQKIILFTHHHKSFYCILFSFLFYFNSKYWTFLVCKTLWHALETNRK